MEDKPQSQYTKHREARLKKKREDYRKKAETHQYKYVTKLSHLSKVD